MPIVNRYLFAVSVSRGGPGDCAGPAAHQVRDWTGRGRGRQHHRALWHDARGPLPRRHPRPPHVQQGHHGTGLQGEVLQVEAHQHRGLRREQGHLQVRIFTRIFAIYVYMFLPAFASNTTGIY